VTELVQWNYGLRVAVVAAEASKRASKSVLRSR
jgi:hypothetical protein